MTGRRVRRYGDAGLLVETPSNGAALALCAALAASGLAVRARPGLRSVLVERRSGPIWRGRSRRARPRGGCAARGGPRPPAAVARVELPVVYDGEDLAGGRRADRARRRRGRGPARRPASTPSRAWGSPPGSPTSRGSTRPCTCPGGTRPGHASPPASWPMAGDQAGVYPRPAPGGWHLLGRTAAVVFDEAADPPALLAPGDRVRFVPVGHGDGHGPRRCSTPGRSRWCRTSAGRGASSGGWLRRAPSTAGRTRSRSGSWATSPAPPASRSCSAGCGSSRPGTSSSPWPARPCR